MQGTYAEQYEARRRALEEAAHKLPSAARSLSPQALARLNRRVLTRGFMCVWWDSKEIQEELADAFTPIVSAKFSERKVPETPVGEALMGLYEAFDRRGDMVDFPAIGKDERYLTAWLDLQCALGKNLGGTQNVRPLQRKEKKALYHLHALVAEADDSFVNTGEALKRKR